MRGGVIYLYEEENGEFGEDIEGTMMGGCRVHKWFEIFVGFDHSRLLDCLAF